MSNRLTFYLDHFISKKDLQIGHVYIQKDGKITMYIDQDVNGRFLFYDMAAVLFESVPAKYSAITPAYYKI